MGNLAVIKTGGKQYLVKENDEIVVDHVVTDKSAKNLELETLAIFEESGKKLEFGNPTLKTKIKAELIENLKGDKIRIAKFKSKVRYRRVKGFRAQLSKLKILSV